MPNKKPKKAKKDKSRIAKKAATVALAAGIGVAVVLDHDQKHIELRHADPDPAILTDGAIIATSTVVSTVMIRKGIFGGK